MITRKYGWIRSYVLSINNSDFSELLFDRPKWRCKHFSSYYWKENPQKDINGLLSDNGELPSNGSWMFKSFSKKNEKLFANRDERRWLITAAVHVKGTLSVILNSETNTSSVKRTSVRWSSTCYVLLQLWWRLCQTVRQF